MSKAVLVTGGAGFVGAHICEHLLVNTDWDVISLDRLSYAGSLARLADLRINYPQRLKVVFHDFRAQYPASVINQLLDVRYIIHNGAETHVDRSLSDAEPFVTSNVLGTMWTLEMARKIDLEHFILVSTDEVHGPAPEGTDFAEDAPIKPSNPYSASKAGAEALAYAYWNSFKLPVTITRTMNLFGERQHTEKFIPMTIRKILNGEEVSVHPGSRKWIHARNQADAMLFLLKEIAASGETYHIAGSERTNYEIAQFIANTLNKHLHFKFVDSHRPGHDLRYSLDDTKIKALGWQPPMAFESSLRKAIEWTAAQENRFWLDSEPVSVKAAKRSFSRL